MPLAPNDFAFRDGDHIEFRREPLRVRIELANLVSADRHDLRCAFEFSARVGDHPADRKLFVELLMSDRPAVTREDVAIHLRPALENSAASITQPAASLLADAGKEIFLETLRKSADAAAFNSGLIILAPFQLELTSPSLQRQQREAAQRSRVEDQAAGRLDHLRHAADLLKQFDTIRAAAPSISAGQVLERIAPADRGALLDAILASNTDRTTDQTLYAVAGPYLVKISLGSDPLQPVTVELPNTLGPLRSVQPADLAGDHRLLVGARTGLLLVDPRDPAAAVPYAEPELNSSLGFNRAIYLPGSRAILATHGEAGLVRWEHADPSAPTTRIRAPQLAPQATGPVRNLLALDDDTAVCSVANFLIFLNGSQRVVLASASPRPIISIVPGGDRLFIIHEDGLIATLNRETRTFVRTDSHGGEVCAASALPWADGLRLLLVSPAGPVECIGPDDSLVTRFNSVYRGLRHITATASCLAAVSPDRQRLVLWNSWDGRAPAHDLHLISLTRHRIADIAFA